MAWFLVSFCDFCVRCFNPCIFQCLCGLSPPCWKRFPIYGKNLPLCSLMDYSFQWQLLVLQVLEQLVASLAHPLNKPKHSSCRIRDISCLNLQKSLGFKQRIRGMLQKSKGACLDSELLSHLLPPRTGTLSHAATETSHGYNLCRYTSDSSPRTLSLKTFLGWICIKASVHLFMQSRDLSFTTSIELPGLWNPNNSYLHCRWTSICPSSVDLVLIKLNIHLSNCQDLEYSKVLKNSATKLVWFLFFFFF